MSPSKDTIEEFKRIYQEEFGETISDSQAYEKFLRLVNLLRVILKEPSPDAPANDLSKAHLLDDNILNDKLKG